MFTFLVVIHVIACTVLVITVLLQQGKGAEVGAVFGSSEAIFGSSGPATLLSKVTTVSAVVFMLTSLSLTYLSIHSRGESVMRKVQQAPVAPAQLPVMPAVPGNVKQEAGQQHAGVPSSQDGRAREQAVPAAEPAGSQSGASKTPVSPASQAAPPAGPQEAPAGQKTK